jgi:hypothetical protein
MAAFVFAGAASKHYTAASNGCFDEANSFRFYGGLLMPRLHWARFRAGPVRPREIDYGRESKPAACTTNRLTDSLAHTAFRHPDYS